MRTTHIGDYVRQMHVISEILHLRPVPHSILDAGSGTGDYGIRLGQILTNSVITGIEIDPELVRIASSAALASKIVNVSFAEGNITKDLGTEIFDLVYSVDVLEHIDDDMTVFKNFHTALKPKSILVLHVPKKNQKFFLNFLGIFDKNQDDHVREGYDENEIRRKLEGLGFEIMARRNTFGMFTSFLWEIMQILNRLGPAGNAVWRVLFSLLRPLVNTEGNKTLARGNGLLIIAKKEQSSA